MTRRRLFRRTLMLLLAARVAVLVCAASPLAVPTLVVTVTEVAILVPLAALAASFTGDYRRHRRSPLPARAALTAAADDMFPPVFRRLCVHEVRLFTSLLRWLSLRGPQGVGETDLPVRYAAGQVFVITAFLFASIVETIALALVIPWPGVRDAVLVIDLWGIYFVIALQASCVVRPHVVLADGSLRLRYGALIDIAIPAARIARARFEPRHDRGGPAKPHPDGSLDLGMGGQTMVTVELTQPVGFTRPLGKTAEARVLRFYADNPAAAVAALQPRRVHS